MGRLRRCTFYTDAWRMFAEALPRRRHVVGKAHTVAIERDNSNTRHHLARFTRRTKVVSRSRRMVDLSLRIRHAVATTDLFHRLQEVAYLYISDHSPNKIRNSARDSGWPGADVHQGFETASSEQPL